MLGAGVDRGEAGGAPPQVLHGEGICKCLVMKLGFYGSLRGPA